MRTRRRYPRPKSRLHIITLEAPNGWLFNISSWHHRSCCPFPSQHGGCKSVRLSRCTCYGCAAQKDLKLNGWALRNIVPSLSLDHRLVLGGWYPPQKYFGHAD